MIFAKKLPNLEPEMRGALRGHIMRKRQRLKQELEQDAIERRLKREKELKQLQDAMTLDQIKEQLCTLEKRLETLKDEKHNLFVQLKQVLNEDTSRRKQQQIETTTDQQQQQQQQQNSHKAKQKDEPEENAPLATNSGAVGSNSIVVDNYQNQTNLSFTTRRVQEPTTSTIPMPRQQQQQQPYLPLLPLSMAPSTRKPLHAMVSPKGSHLKPAASYTGQFVRTPLPWPIQDAYPGSTPNEATNAKLLGIHQQFKPSTSTGARSMSDLMAPGILDFNQQVQLGNRPSMIDIPMSLALNHNDTRFRAFKRSLSAASLNESHLDDRGIAGRKKLNSFMYSNPSNHFLLNDVHTHNISTYNRQAMGPQSPIELSVPSFSGQNSNQSHHHYPRKQLPPQQMATSFNYMMDQGKPNIMPGFYQTPTPLISPIPLYSNADKDLKHFTAPYSVSPSAQQYGNLSRHNNSQSIYPPDHSSQYFTTNLNYSRKPSHNQNNLYPPKK